MEKTLTNLTKAFIGESQARNRYNFYASKARKEGYEQIGVIFQETADQEKEHAKRIFEIIVELKSKLGKKADDTVTVEAESPSVYGDTASNLEAAARGENHEHKVMYPEFAKIASQEGLPEVSARLKSIAKAEAHHEERYLKLLAEVRNGTVFKKKEKVMWICRECGYQHEATEAPIKCPSCDHAQSFYQVKCENY